MEVVTKQKYRALRGGLKILGNQMFYGFVQITPFSGTFLRV